MPCHSGIVQSVEQWTVNPYVTGSSPVARAKISAVSADFLYQKFAAICSGTQGSKISKNDVVFSDQIRCQKMGCKNTIILRMQTRMSGCCVCQRITFAKKWAIKSNKQHKKRALFSKNCSQCSANKY